MAYSTINKPTDYFENLTWSGNSTDDRAISGLDFAPNFVWIKCRNNGQNHNLFNTITGATKYLQSNASNAEETDATSLKSFTSDGYTLGTGSTVNSSSPSTKTYASWNWKANGSGSANTDGTISSTVSANTTSGFSIVSWDGSDANGNIGHGLGLAPRVIFIKNRESAEQWYVYHESMGNGNKLTLNDNSAQSSAADWWQDTSPTSSVFYVSGVDGINGPHQMIAYCFAEKTGYSKFGSYVGNGNADGTFVYTGFKPAFIIVKRTDTTGDWQLMDNKRDPINAMDTNLFPNTTDVDTSSSTYDTDFVSNGFKFRGTSGARNGSGSTYIYMAFAEAPLVGTNNVPANAR